MMPKSQREPQLPRPVAVLPPSLTLRAEADPRHLIGSWLTAWEYMPAEAKSIVSWVQQERRRRQVRGGDVLLLSPPAFHLIDPTPLVAACYRAAVASYAFRSDVAEAMPEEVLTTMIAHEHAHAVLWAIGDDWTNEARCNEMVEWWGFPLDDLIDWSTEVAIASARG